MRSSISLMSSTAGSKRSKALVGRQLYVGSGQQYTTIAAAAAASVSGDTINITSTLSGAAAVGTWNTSNILIRGVGGRQTIDANGFDAQGKGTWVTGGNNIVVENLNFYNAAVPDENGAAIRLEGLSLTINYCGFYDGENGIQGGAGGGTGDYYLNFCEFARNGFGDGFTHNVYIDSCNSVTAIGCYFHEAKIGHNFKSRCRITRLENCYIMDGPTGTASYLVDTPNGGAVYLRGNCFHKGPNADNSAAVAFLQEGSAWATSTLTMIHNTIAQTRSGGSFVVAPSSGSGTDGITWTANIFAGTGSPSLISGGFPLGSVVQANNVTSTASNIPNCDNIATPNFWPNSTLQALALTGGVPDATYVNDAPTPYTLRGIVANPRYAGAIQAAP